MTTTITYHIGDVRDVMSAMPDGSVDLVVTSPPFLALRSYLPADHELKHREIGSEPTPAAFLDTMLGLTADWRRLLAAYGSICVEIGDTYSHEGPGKPMTHHHGHGYDYEHTKGRTSLKDPNGWPLAKSLCGIPTLYTWSLAYGRNLLTGDTSPAGTWRIRNLLTWTRPNPPVGALGDKFRPATSFVTVACVGARRWFDLDAVRTGLVKPESAAPTWGGSSTTGGIPGKGLRLTQPSNPAGAPPLDWWDAADDPDWQPLHRLPTSPYKGAHYATYPVALPARLIAAMCPGSVCVACGVPRERIVGPATYDRTDSDRVPARLAQSNGTRVATGVHQHVMANGANTSVIRNAPTVGWSDCGCRTPCGSVAPVSRQRCRLDAGHDQLHTDGGPGGWTGTPTDRWKPGLVLDPFGGSGTTAIAAAQSGRDALLIDIDPRNVDLARERIADQLRIVSEVVDGDRIEWTVDTPLPHQKAQTVGQTSIFDYSHDNDGDAA